MNAEEQRKKVCGMINGFIVDEKTATKEYAELSRELEELYKEDPKMLHMAGIPKEIGKQEATHNEIFKHLKNVIGC